MSFYNKYELVEVLRDDGVKTFQARELENERPVEVHLIVGQPGKSEPPYDLLEKIRAFTPENRSHVVEIGDHMGTPYVVTLPLGGFASFRDWVASKSAEAKPAYDPLARVGTWKLPTGSPSSPAVTKKQAAPVPVPPTIRPVETPDITRTNAPSNPRSIKLT